MISTAAFGRASKLVLNFGQLLPYHDHFDQIKNNSNPRIEIRQETMGKLSTSNIQTKNCNFIFEDQPLIKRIKKRTQ